MARTAPVEQKSADLATEFGREYATRLFGARAIASLPVRTAGKNKGAPKGHVVWLKTTAPGWTREAGPVGAGTVIAAWIGQSGFSSRGDAMSGHWLGRTQPLSGSRGMLGADGQARHRAEVVQQARDCGAQAAGMESPERRPWGKLLSTLAEANDIPLPELEAAWLAGFDEEAAARAA